MDFSHDSDSVDAAVAAAIDGYVPALFDGDAYPVVVDDRLHYIIDAYTTTSRYPYAQQADTSGLIRSSDLRGKRFNYVRNSVKAVVDAYDGDVDLYVMPDADPIIEAWRGAFPDLFSDFDEMPAGLGARLPGIAREALSGRYWRFSYGLKSLAQDVWLR